MRAKISTITLLALITSSIVHAASIEESKIAMTEKELQLMKEGFKYIEPTPEQKQSGVVSIYEKITCSQGVKCGIKNLSEEEFKKKSKKSVVKW